VSLSSTEAEFLAASDAGKMGLYLRSILDELSVSQQFATVIYEDNRGALLMASAAQPTKQSRHIDIREYALLDWRLNATLLPSKMLRLVSMPVTFSPNKLVLSYLLDTSTISLVACLHHMSSFMLPSLLDSLPTLLLLALLLRHLSTAAPVSSEGGVSLPVCLSIYRSSGVPASLPTSRLSVCP
jgi:hypothetical protein